MRAYRAAPGPCCVRGMGVRRCVQEVRAFQEALELKAEECLALRSRVDKLKDEARALEEQNEQLQGSLRSLADQAEEVCGPGPTRHAAPLPPGFCLPSSIGVAVGALMACISL